ncbi:MULTISPECIES: ABC transporter permease [Clostridium]|uniref:ABC transporter permease n=1 Tax=Clostridium TaxID=1485 RepID=UPI00069F4CB8|nr:MULTISPECIES: ABC transporter permease [Clostridium]KOF56999.1 molybdate ABC transporter permease [Clostridium sp. DMHC 10]MCD2348932.1 ABC transporter permease [Clostridium guangxiense]
MVEDGVKLRRKYTGVFVKGIRNNFVMEKILSPTMVCMAVIYIFLLVLPILSLMKYAGVYNILQNVRNAENINCILLSLVTSLVSLVITFLFGTATAFYIANISNNKMAKLLDIIVEMPIVLPPAVAGIALLLALGSNGFIGRFLSQYNIDIVFTPIAVVIAQVFVSSAFYVRVLRDSIRSVPDEIFEATYVFGAGKVETNIRVIIPMLKNSIISGLILAWVRSMGEFGATLMFAGNILNKTRTIPLEIYTLMQSDIKTATAFAAILYILSFSMLVIVRMNQKEDK